MGGGASLPTLQAEKVKWVMSTPAFKDLPEDKLESVVQKVKLVQYKAGDILIEEGTTGTLFGILVSGKLQISARGPNDKEIVLCQQLPGFFFGEAAIIGNTTTTATIKAVENSAILALTSVELQNLATDHADVRNSLLRTVSLRMKQNLMKIPLFAQMELLLERKKYFKLLGAFDLLSTLFEVEQFKKKDIIFKAGDNGEKLYVLCEGCVKITSSDTPDGNELTLNMLTKNEVFGEIALLEETTRTATASAFESVILLSITREKFASLLEVFPKFEEVMAPLLKERTGNTLKLIPFFKKVDKKRRSLIGQMSRFTSFLTGMTVLKEKDRYDGLYIIVEGTVKVTTINELGVVVTLGVCEKGALLGELAILANRRRTATLTTLDACRMLFIPTANIGSLFSVAPELVEDIINLANQRRAKSIEMLGENYEDVIPKVDEDTESKLHIYSLLRNNAAHEQSAEGGNKWGRAGASELKEEVGHAKIYRNDADTMKSLMAENNKLRHESQFLDIQIFDILTCIKLLEDDGTKPATEVKEDYKEGGLSGGGGKEGQNGTMSNVVRVTRQRRHSWPKVKNQKVRVQEVLHVDELEGVKFSPKAMKRKLSIMEEGKMKSPRELLEVARTAEGAKEEPQEEEIAKIEFDNFSSAAIVAATTVEEAEVKKEGGKVTGVKYRRKSAPNSGTSTGERRKSFVGVELNL